MGWTYPHLDLASLIQDMGLPAFPSLILRGHTGEIRDRPLRGLICDRLLGADPVRVTCATGPRGTAYERPGGLP